MCCWMLGYVEVDNSASVVRQHEENEEHFECRSRHDKEIDRDKLFEVQIGKRPLRGRG